MIADQHLANVITVSLGDGENDFINDPTNPTASQQAAIHSLDPAFLDAAAHNIPVMFASGDCGPTDADGPQRHRPVHPGDRRHRGSPGRQPVGHRGRRHHPQRRPRHRVRAYRPGRAVDRQERQLRRGERRHIHHLPAAVVAAGHPGAGGVTGRAYPDISMDASDGTSQASPTFAGILALATPAARRRPGHGEPGPGGDRAARRRGRHHRCPGRLHGQRLRRHRLLNRDRLRHRVRLGHHLRARLSCPPWSGRSTGSTGRSSRAGWRSSS